MTWSRLGRGVIQQPLSKHPKSSKKKDKRNKPATKQRNKPKQRNKERNITKTGKTKERTKESKLGTQPENTIAAQVGEVIDVTEVKPPTEADPSGGPGLFFGNEGYERMRGLENDMHFKDVLSCFNSLLIYNLISF